MLLYAAGPPRLLFRGSASTAMLTSTIELILNRGLPRSPRARNLCSELAEQRIIVEIHGIGEFQIQSDGNAVKVARGAAEGAGARVSGGLTAMLAILQEDAATGPRRSDVQLSGDTELAEKFRELLFALRPDPEEELALVIGDVPAHEIARFTRATLRWSRRAAGTTLRNIAEFLAHERGDLVSSAEGRQFLTGVDEVREGLERLQARMELLAGRVATVRRESSGA